MVQLVAALLLGILLTAPPPGLRTFVAAAFPVYVHLLVVGWATQMIFGVAFWMFPRPAPERGHGGGALGWLCFVTLNAGLAMRAVAEPAGAIQPSRIAGFALVLAALLQLVAVLAFVALVWRRVVTR
jgi:cbb3-type cytochrome oxidase subunit 1